MEEIPEKARQRDWIIGLRQEKYFMGVQNLQEYIKRAVKGHQRIITLGRQEYRTIDTPRTNVCWVYECFERFLILTETRWIWLSAHSSSFISMLPPWDKRNMHYSIRSFLAKATIGGQAQALVNLLTIRISRENHQHAGRWQQQWISARD